MSPDSLAERSYARAYRVTGRRDVHTFVSAAIERCGGRVLFATGHERAPIFFGVQLEGDERLGVLLYPFRCNPPPIAARPPDEHRLQVRYGGEASWRQDHPIGIDVAGVDVTVVLGVHLQREMFVGLDPLLYHPLPMGISVEFKDRHVDSVRKDGWAVWERENRAGRRRTASRSLSGLETLVGFLPERLIDYVRFEREATSLGLDPPLRYRAAEAHPTRGTTRSSLHRLETEFELSSAEILGIIQERMRLKVAVRGGVAEHHLGRVLQRSPEVKTVTPIDEDGKPDFDVTLVSGRHVTVECKNVSPERGARGAIKVEVQKTRSSRGDPASRFYRIDQFDLVAASLWPVTKKWDFVFKQTRRLAPHGTTPGRVAPIQVVDDSWTPSIQEALS